MNKDRIAVVGSSVSGCLMAAFLADQQTDSEIVLIDSGQRNRPIVGESLTEFSTQLLHELGLTGYLEEEHYHKYGLTFYFKENLDDPSDRKYAVHEALAIPPLPSNQLNRFTFDNKLRELLNEKNVRIIAGQVVDCELSDDSFHTLSIRQTGGDKLELSADYVVDATGRNRLLAKKLKLDSPAPFQRSSFWFRLVDFDRSILSKLEAIKPKQQAFDSYFATHHFMGRANWIWCIPMRTNEYKDMISIGIVWRPDLLDTKISNLEQFLEQVAKEHPVLIDLINSGKVIDTNLYRNYLYEASKVYSDNGWYLVGDAGDAVDPLYSTGLVMTSIQIRQINELISLDRENKLTSATVEAFEGAYKTLRNAMQYEISTYYEVMHDPYQAHWRMHVISTYYFFFLLPAWLSGYMTSKFGTRFIKGFIENGAESYGHLLSALPIASKRLGRQPASKIVNHYDRSVNWDLWVGKEEDLGRYISIMWRRFASYRFEFLRKSGWHDWYQHVKFIARDAWRHLFWKFRFSGCKLSESKYFSKIFQDESEETLIGPRKKTHEQGVDSSNKNMQEAA